MDNIQKIFSDNWAIEHNGLRNMMALLMPSVTAGNLKEVSACVAESDSCTVKAAGAPNLAKWWEIDDISLPDNSVAVVYLYGILYSWKSEWLVEVINAAEQNPRICGIVLAIDGPGGMVSHVDQAAAAVRNCSKPVATVVTGVMASAHFWIGSSARHTFIASPLCEVGSVGIVMTYMGLRKFFEMNGIDYREIYPDTADLKNAPSRAIDDNGDESLIKQRAERIHKLFSETVAENLGISYDPELPLFRGEMFDAATAVEAGYIDEHGGLEDAVRWVLGTATAQRAQEYK